MLTTDIQAFEHVRIARDLATRAQVHAQEKKVGAKAQFAKVGDAYDRSVLIRDSNKTVAMSVVKSPKVKENEVVGWSSNRSRLSFRARSAAIGLRPIIQSVHLQKNGA